MSNWHELSKVKAKSKLEGLKCKICGKIALRYSKETGARCKTHQTVMEAPPDVLAKLIFSYIENHDETTDFWL